MLPHSVGTMCDRGAMVALLRWAPLALALAAATACGQDSAQPASSPQQESSTAPALPSPAAVSTTSPGCSSTDPQAPIAGVMTTRTVVVDGLERPYLLRLPPTYQPGKPIPTVVTFHGMGSTADQQLLVTAVGTSADKNGYAVIAPQGNSGTWALPPDNQTTVTTPEDGYVDAMLADAEGAACLDPSRMYAAGMSMGSAMTFVQACKPDRRFAAFGGVAVAIYRPICDQAPPAPLIYFHGRGDQTVPFNGGDARGYQVAPVPQTMDEWVAHNHCAAGPAVTVTEDVTKRVWTDCAQNAEVDFYEIDGGGHTWPGSAITALPYIEQYLGRTTMTISATDLMWDFFSRYQLPTK